MFSKNEIRNISKNLRHKINIEKTSNDVISNLFSLSFFNAYNNIFTYISTKNEIDTSLIFKIENKNIFVPKIDGKNMFFAKYNSQKLIPNAYGILEPESNDVNIPDKNDLMIIPALACDINFNRLGYGGGYYDRFLQNNECIKIALIPDILLLEQIPEENFDVKVDIIVTEKRILRR